MIDQSTRGAIGGKPATRDREEGTKAGIAAGMKAAATMLCLTEQEVLIARGEMTAQETRTVNAMLDWFVRN